MVGVFMAVLFNANDFLLKLNKLLSRLGTVKSTEMVIFLKQFAALIESGITIVSSLSILFNQTKNKCLKFALSDIRSAVEAGMSLSEAMEKHPKIFNKTICSTIRVGETSGLLDTSITQVVEYLDEQAALKREVTTALIYPLIVLTATVGVIAFMVLVVIPQMIPFIEMMGGEMPWNTLLLIEITEYIGQNIETIAISLLSIIAFSLLAYRTRRGKYYMDFAKMYIPFAGIIIRYNLIVQFTKTMYLLLSSGVTIVESLRIVRDANKNAVIRTAIERFIGLVLLGESLSEAILKEKHLFPLIVGSMARVGEETGTMDISMKRIADIHYSILRGYIKKLNSALEPVMLLVLGGLVGFVASGMIGGILAGYTVPN